VIEMVWIDPDVEIMSEFSRTTRGARAPPKYRYA
jgi:hypothetical protein